MDMVSREKLAMLAGCDDARLLEVERLGIIEPGSNGYAVSDVSRLRLVMALEEAGIGLEQLAEGLRRQVFSLEFASQLIFDPVTISESSIADAMGGSAVDLPDINTLRSSAGLPLLSPAQPLREDDAEFIQLIGQCAALGASADGMQRVLRVSGQSMRRCIDAMRDLFRGEVEDPMLNAGLSYREVLATGAAKRLALQRIGVRVLFLLQRRILEEAVFDNVVGRLQDALHEQGLDSGRGNEEMPAVAFADLAGFTALTHDIGDAGAAEKAARFEALAQQLSRSCGGRIIKPLGDGVMMLFPDAGAAVETSLSLVEQCSAHELPEVRCGVATGQVVPRDGDIFGRTVNLAARIVAAAEPSQILVCGSTHGATADERQDLDFAALDPKPLKGFTDPVPLFSVDRKL